MTHHRWIARVFALAALLSTPSIVPAQGISPTDAGDYMGIWTMTMEGPQGAFEQELDLKDKDGKVVGELTNAMTPPQTITDISKSGADLVMKYEGNYQGNPYSAILTMTPDGSNKAKVTFDVNSGMFTMSGSASKK
jgi:hypothetical protein